MLLCSIYPNAWRVRPGRGDGGVDIFVPLDPSRHRRKVFQVKRYATNLTSGQKREIKRSFNRVVKSANDEGWEIDSWTLVMPLDPTPGNESWFSTFTGSAGFPCDWMGLNRVEHLASKNPKVVDYYLHDGRERLQEQTDRLAGILAGRANRSVGEPLQPIDVRDDLLDIYRAINEYDPHYRYEISMTAQPPERTDGIQPGLVAVTGYGSEGNGWVNVSVFATSMAALEERPLSGNLTIYQPETGSDLEEDFRRFLDYGTPLNLPEGQSLVDFPLPGGLGTSSTRGTLSISPVDVIDSADPSLNLLVGVLSPEGATISELKVKRAEGSQGFNGGYRTVWRDLAGLLRLEILISPDGEGAMNVRYEGDFAGFAPSDVVDALTFWAHAHAPNSVGLSRAYGPREYETMRTSELTGAPDREMKAIARSARDLSTIQDHTPHRLVMPPKMSRKEALEVNRIAQILSGTPVSGTWSRFSVDLHADNDLALTVGDEIMVSIVRSLDLELNGVTVVVGKEMCLVTGRIAVLNESKLKIVPIEDGAEGSTVVQFRFDGAEEPGRVFFKPLRDEQ